MSAMAWVFFLALSTCGYVYFGYPLLLLAVARLRPRPVRRAPLFPRISVVVPAHNEANLIEEKLRSTLASGYPGDRLEVLVASDGSTDDTVAVARRINDSRVRVLDLPRCGKAATLNAAARQAEGEVLVFTDADTFLEPGALAYVAENFADPDVGGVAGRKVHRPSGNGHLTVGEGLYVRYDEWQRGLESTIGSVVAAHGALHAIRRSLFRPVTNPDAADDMAISMPVVLQGHRLVYDPRATARVDAPVEAGIEIQRKVRIANQVMRALFDLGPSLWTNGFYSVQLVSHKLLRYLVPFFLAAMLLANFLLAEHTATLAWDVLMGLQCAFYAAALLGTMLRGSGAGSLRVFTVPYYFVLVNTAAMLAVFSVLRGQRASSWSPGGGFDLRPTVR